VSGALNAMSWHCPLYG